MQYRKKPVVVCAWLWKGSTLSDANNFALLTGLEGFIFGHSGLRIKTLEGEMLVSKGDFVIRGVAGEYYPCKPDIFYATYEEVEKRGKPK